MLEMSQSGIHVFQEACLKETWRMVWRGQEAVRELPWAFLSVGTVTGTMIELSMIPSRDQGSGYKDCPPATVQSHHFLTQSPSLAPMALRINPGVLHLPFKVLNELAPSCLSSRILTSSPYSSDIYQHTNTPFP